MTEESKDPGRQEPEAASGWPGKGHSGNASHGVSLDRTRQPDAKTSFSTMMLPKVCDVHAPDGSEVRILSALASGTLAHFLLGAGQVSQAIRHRTVEEIWFILSGSGEMWRAGTISEAVVELAPGLSLTIPVGTKFQFRSHGDQPLTAIAITMPPWPGDDEADVVAGPWKPSVVGAK